MVSIRAEVDVAPVLAVLATFASPAFERVVALAMNDTVKNGQVQATKILAPAMGLKSAEVKKSLRNELARSGRLVAVLVAQGRPIPMIRFKVRDTHRTGVHLRIGGKVEVYSRAFITTVRNAHRGVFERRGKDRLPIRELFGPSVPGYFARTDALPVVQQTMRERLLVNVTRQVDRGMRLAQGKVPRR